MLGMDQKTPSLSSECYVLKERFETASDAATRAAINRSGKTYAVAAAVTAGVKIRPDGFSRVIDGDDNSRTTVAFTVVDQEAVTFEEFAGETIDLPTLFTRLQDEKWIEENPTHPIAWMYYALRNYTTMVKAIREHRPLIQYARGKSKALLVVRGDREANAAILRKAKFTESEITQILDSLPN